MPITTSRWRCRATFPRRLTALAARVSPKPGLVATERQIRCLLREELERGRQDDSYPVKPQRLVADIRAALGREDIVLVDSGAVKMWMARLYPTYRPNTCLVSNGLSTMGFALPGALGVKLAYPGRKVLAVMGDGGFLMNSQEIETALREKIPFVILVWVDGSYGLIKWKMDMQLQRSSQVDFGNPDFVQVRRKLRGQGLFYPGGRRPAADAQAGPGRGHGLGDRLPGGLLGEHQTHREAGASDPAG